MAKIVLTGANRGIGLAILTQLLADGHVVAATCRTPEKATALQTLAKKYDGLHVYQLDVTDEESIKVAAGLISAEFHTIDILINNAGVLIGGEKLDTIKAEDMRFTFDVNVIGPMMVVKHFANLLRQGDNPRLLNISSQLGSLAIMQDGQHGIFSYNASKAALNMLTRMLAHDLRAAGVTVVTVHPGWVQTDMGGTQAPTAPQESASGIINLLNRLTLDDTNKFFTFEGVEHAW